MISRIRWTLCLCDALLVDVAYRGALVTTPRVIRTATSGPVHAGQQLLGQLLVHQHQNYDLPLQSIQIPTVSECFFSNTSRIIHRSNRVALLCHHHTAPALLILK